MLTTMAELTITNSNGDYALGYTNFEHERLIRQAARIAPYTERLFREAGIGPGQRVLDLGSGVGDVSMLLARIVGPSGTVVGIERDSYSIERANARVVVDKIIAVGDYVFAHVNFLNLFNDDPEDTGIAGVDIYKMDSDGRALEHWDTLQPVGDPKNSAPWLAPNLPRANPNGMF